MDKNIEQVGEPSCQGGLGAELESHDGNEGSFGDKRKHAVALRLKLPRDFSPHSKLALANT